jgi:TetR/AcrR family transcriptional repressor of nem operon
MSEHSENIRKAIFIKEQMVLSLITEVIQEAKDIGEIESPMDAGVLAAFIEDAGKGSMISMKEMQSSEPIDNFMTMGIGVLLK